MKTANGRKLSRAIYRSLTVIDSSAITRIFSRVPNVSLQVAKYIGKEFTKKEICKMKLTDWAELTPTGRKRKLGNNIAENIMKFIYN